MLNTKISRVNSFANQQSVLVDTSWNTYWNKPWLGNWWKIISLFKQQTDAILNDEQVRDGYYYSKSKWIIKSDKEIIINYAYNESNKHNFTDEENIYFAKQRTLFILNETRENNSFNYITEKKEIIKNNVWSFIEQLAHNWWNSFSTLEYEMLHEYIKKWYIWLNIVKESINKYIIFKAK